MPALAPLLIVGTSTADPSAIASALRNGGLEVAPHSDGARLSARLGPSEIALEVATAAPAGAPAASGYVSLAAEMGLAEPLLDLPQDRARRSRLGFVLAGAVMALWEHRLATFVMAQGMVEPVESFCREVLAAPRDRPLVGPFVRFRVSPDRAEVRTLGAGLLGLPDVATAAVPRDELGVERAERALAALVLLWASPTEPADNVDLPRRYEVTELPSGVRWLTDATLEGGAAEAAHTKHQFFFRTLASACFGGNVAGVDAWLAGSPRFHVMRLVCGGGLVAYLTNGLGAQAQAGGSAEDENDRVEICAIAPCEVPGLADVVARLGSMVHAPGARPPLRPWDRCAVACPAHVDIAGVVLRPLTAFEVEPLRTVRIWDALPITQEELTRFRSDGAAQDQWIDERFAREDYAAIHARWRALAGS